VARIPNVGPNAVSGLDHTPIGGEVDGPPAGWDDIVTVNELADPDAPAYQAVEAIVAAGGGGSGFDDAAAQAEFAEAMA
jgi:hypothetical protein